MGRVKICLLSQGKCSRSSISLWPLEVLSFFRSVDF